MNEMTRTSPAPTPAPQANRAPQNGFGPIGWLRGEIDRLFDDFGWPGSIFNFPQRTVAPVPAMELVDGEKEYCLSVELPGMTDKDVEISVAAGVLTISGEKQEESERKDNGYLLSERRYGRFKRQIALPSDVAADSIKARFEKGVLELTLAKDKRAQKDVQKIPIES